MADLQTVEQLLQQRVRAAYHQREIRYPVQYAMETILGRATPGDAYALERLATWANRKFNLNWTVDDLRQRDPKQLYDELVKLNTEYVSDGRLAAEVDEALARPREEWMAWAKQRFGRLFDEQAVTDGQDPREALLKAGQEMLRYELTMLEQVVLLRIYDTTWKDHLYAMDRLKEGIGLRGYAERDPKIEYKREGFRMFSEMMDRIREHVTDIIFKVEIADESSIRSVFQVSQTSHADTTNMGLSVQQTPDQQAAMRAQGGETKPVTQPIRRDVPRVGRNDPCPCGSGKKYKQCHGRGLK